VSGLAYRLIKKSVTKCEDEREGSDLDVSEVGQQNVAAAPIVKKIVRPRSRAVREAIMKKHKEHDAMAKAEYVSDDDRKAYQFL
jgi:hypothetical protein